MSMTNSNDNIGSRNRDLTFGSAVPQPTAPPGIPTKWVTICKIRPVCIVYCVPQQNDSAVNITRYTLSRIIHTVAQLLNLLLECINYTTQRWLFNGWNMLEWRIALIKWWLINIRVNLSIVIWYSRRVWESHIKMDLQGVGCEGMDWIDVAQDMDRWRTLVNVVMNLRIPKKSGEFLD